MIRIGTRGSDLALWQARHIASLITAKTGEEPRLVVVKTKGDRIQDLPLTPDLGKSFFTKEIEDGLLRGDFDLAVHSLKDLAVEQPEGLCLASVPPRAPAGERLLVRPEAWAPEWSGLPLREGARLGTSSPRRRLQAASLRPDLEFAELRGNVPTRLRKLREGKYDAILLAQAGIRRLDLDLDGLEVYDLAPEDFPGAPGQGALGLQARTDDREVRALLASFEDPATREAVEVERGLLKALGGGCSLPLGAHARKDAEGRLHLTAFLFHPDGKAPALRFTGSGECGETLTAAAHRRLAPTLEQPLAGTRLRLRGGPVEPSLAGDLRAAGASVEHECCFEIEDLDPPGEDLQALEEADHLCLASKGAASRLAAIVRDGKAEIRGDAVLVVPGRGTEEVAARAFPGNPILRADPPRSEGLGRTALANGAKKVCFLGALGGRLDGLRILEEAGTVEGRHIPLYRTSLRPGEEEGPADPDSDPVLYLAPAAVQARPPSGGERLVLALGPTTALPLEALGLPRLVKLSSPDLEAVLGVLPPGKEERS